jgi:hypothetical protein
MGCKRRQNYAYRHPCCRRSLLPLFQVPCPARTSCFCPDEIAFTWCRLEHRRASVPVWYSRLPGYARWRVACDGRFALCQVGRITVDLCWAKQGQDMRMINMENAPARNTLAAIMVWRLGRLTASLAELAYIRYTVILSRLRSISMKGINGLRLQLEREGRS